MQKILLTCFGLLTLAATAVNALADTIVMKDGTIKTVYNVEEAGEWILYTDGADKNSALHRIAVAEVFAIKSDDGQMRTVGASTQPAPAAPQPAVQDNAVPAAPKMIPPVAHADNQIIINEYNSKQFTIEKNKDKIYRGGVNTLWGIGRESVICDSLVQIEFEYYQGSDSGIWQDGYKVALYNNGNAPVYIDLTNSFRIIDGMATPFYDGATYTQNSGGSKGGSFNVGALAGALGVGGALGTLASGVNVGGGTSSGISVTTSDQPILTVPPHSKVYLPLRKFVEGKKIYDKYENFYWKNGKTKKEIKSELKMGKGDSLKNIEQMGNKSDSKEITAESMQLKKGQTVDFAEDESPKEYGFRISYSTRPDFTEYTTLPVKLYLKQVFGKRWEWTKSVGARTLVGGGYIE